MIIQWSQEVTFRPKQAQNFSKMIKIQNFSMLVYLLFRGENPGPPPCPETFCDHCKPSWMSMLLQAKSPQYILIKQLLSHDTVFSRASHTKTSKSQQLGMLSHNENVRMMNWCDCIILTGKQLQADMFCLEYAKFIWGEGVYWGNEGHGATGIWSTYSFYILTQFNYTTRIM